MDGSAATMMRHRRERRLLWYVVLGVLVLGFVSFVPPNPPDTPAAAPAGMLHAGRTHEP